MENAYSKGIFISLWGALSALFGVLALPMILMLACNIIDYATGLMAIPYRGDTPKSYKHIHGLIKKISMWLLVAVGGVIDALLKYASGQLGINFPFNYLFACVVCVWIICNEILSILENLRDIGIKVPAFMYAPVDAVQGQIDTITGAAEDTYENNQKREVKRE